MWGHTLIIASLFVATVWAGVFPNYHPNFDFVPWDKDKSVEDYEAGMKWWQTASFYQIYPRSFKDTDGDGVGDLKDSNLLSNLYSPLFLPFQLGNHDQNRVGSRLGEDRIDMLNMLTFTLPGCSVTYNGEEIGMTDVWISWNDTVDPSACNSNPDIYETLSRDPERTPFQWSDEVGAGFSKANKTWLPISPLFKEVNVKKERDNPLSHLNIFKDLQQLRNEPTMKHGQVEVKALKQNVLAVKRTLFKDFSYVSLLNIFDEVETVNLQYAFDNMPKDMVYHIITDKSTVKKGDHLKSLTVKLLPKEAVILKSAGKLSTTAGYYLYYGPEEKAQH